MTMVNSGFRGLNNLFNAKLITLDIYINIYTKESYGHGYVVTVQSNKHLSQQQIAFKTAV